MKKTFRIDSGSPEHRALEARINDSRAEASKAEADTVANDKARAKRIAKARDEAAYAAARKEGPVALAAYWTKRRAGQAVTA